MMEQIKSAEGAKGKMIRDIVDCWGLFEGMLFVFTDDTFLLVESDGSDMYVSRDMRPLDWRTDVLLQLGILGDQELADLKRAYELEFKAKQERIERDQYEYLKKKYGG